LNIEIKRNEVNRRDITVICKLFTKCLYCSDASHEWQEQNNYIVRKLKIHLNVYQMCMFKLEDTATQRLKDLKQVKIINTSLTTSYL